MWRTALLTGAICLEFAGCSKPSSGNRISVAGNVTRAGAPVVKANIVFQPVKGATGQGSGGDVYNGRYVIPNESGPTPGQRYKVTVMTQPEKFLKETAREGKGAGSQGNEKQYVLEMEVDIPQKDTTSLDLVFE